jgi:hypothetical protein
MEVAWHTLNMEKVSEPCILTNWIMKVEFFERVAGRSLWEDKIDVAVEAFRRVGANLCPQLALPHSPEEYRTNDYHASFYSTQEEWKSPEQVVEHIERLPDLDRLRWDFNLEEARDKYAGWLMDMRELTRDDILWISGFGQADFMGGYSRWGYNNYLECLMLYPDSMRRYYEYTGEQAYLQNTVIVAAIKENDLAPFVYSGQDICFNEGPICSPDLLREIYFPYLKQAVEPLISNDIRIIWHCDGNILPILNDLIDLGVSGFQGFQEESGVRLENMVKVRTKWGKKPIIWGSVSVTTTLPFGTVEDVKKDVERCFDVAAPGGGFVLASTSSILPETPLENILALYEHGIEYGRKVLGASL